MASFPFPFFGLSKAKHEKKPGKLVCRLFLIFFFFYYLKTKLRPSSKVKPGKPASTFPKKRNQQTRGSLFSWNRDWGVLYYVDTTAIELSGPLSQVPSNQICITGEIFTKKTHTHTEVKKGPSAFLFYSINKGKQHPSTLISIS